MIDKFKKDIGLYNTDISKYYSGNNNYIGNYSIHDRLPLLRTDQFIILNLDLPTNGGTHWVGLYRKNKNLIYIDSFGVPPSDLLREYSQKLKLNINYQNEDIQLLTSHLCGFYVIYFFDNLIIRRFRSIINDFTGDGSKKNVDILYNHLRPTR